MAAAMSTLSSSLSASASAVISDWWLPRLRANPSQAALVKLTRWITVQFGIIQIAIGIWASTFDESVVSNALTIAGFASGVLWDSLLSAFLRKSTLGCCGRVRRRLWLVNHACHQYGVPWWGWKIAFPWLPSSERSPPTRRGRSTRLFVQLLFIFIT